MNRREIIQAGTAALAAVGLSNCSAAVIEPKSDCVLLIKVPNGLNCQVFNDLLQAIKKSGISSPVMILPEGFEAELLSERQIDELQNALAMAKLSIRNPQLT